MEKPELDKLLRYFIHEHSNALSLIQNAKKGVKVRFDKENNISKEDFDKMVGFIDQGLKRCTEAVDYLYIKLKE